MTIQRNKGIRKATGDILYFFDDDILLSPDYLMILTRTFEDHPEYYGGMGNIEGFVDNSLKRRIVNGVKRFLLLQHNQGNGRFYLSGWPQNPYGTDKFQEVEVLGGGLTGYRKEVFNEFSFDEFYRLYGALEDADFSRMVSYKHKLFYNPLARCIHLHEGGSRFEGKEKAEHFMYNYMYFFFKNFYSRNRWFIIPFLWSIPWYVIYPISIKEFSGKISGICKHLK